MKKDDSKSSVQKNLKLQQTIHALYVQGVQKLNLGIQLEQKKEFAKSCEYLQAAKKDLGSFCQALLQFPQAGLALFKEERAVNLIYHKVLKSIQEIDKNLPGIAKKSEEKLQQELEQLFTIMYTPPSPLPLEQKEGSLSTSISAPPPRQYTMAEEEKLRRQIAGLCTCGVVYQSPQASTRGDGALATTAMAAATTTTKIAK